MEAGEDYFEFANSEDPILQLIWQRHCRDTVQDPANSEAFEAFIANLPWSRTFTAKGKRVVLSRWFSWMEAGREVYPRRHELMAVLLFLGLTLGSVHSSREVFRKDPWGLPAAAACPQLDPRGSEAACSQRAASVAAACPQPQGPELGAADVKETVAHGHSDEDVATLRSRCKDTLHASLLVAADDDLWSSVGMIMAASRSVWQAHSRHAATCRGPHDVMQWYASQAAGPPHAIFPQKSPALQNHLSSL